jgi:predicted amidohydrolase YtcJ
MIVITILATGCVDEETVQPADLVFRGSAVYTVNPAEPWAQAVAVADGRITYVGDEHGVAAWIGEGTQVIELKDGMLLPGFHDAHMHPITAGTTYLRCPLDGLTWPEDVLSKLSECVARLQEGEWLRATGLDPSVIQGQGPGMAILDGVSAGHPALISDQFSHNCWLNSRALEMAGIDADTPDPEGGKIVRIPNSKEPSGILRESALNLVWGMASNYPKHALMEGLKLASERANRLGITTSSEAAALTQHWDAYRAAEQAGEMTLRVNAALRWNPQEGPEQLRDLERMRQQADGPRFRADSVKIFVDGDVMSRSASLLEPYGGSNDPGLSNYGKKLDELVSILDASGFHVHMHAYGDRAVRDGLDAIESAIKTNPSWERRHQLAHVALIHPDDVPRFDELGVTANIQLLWAWFNEERQHECEFLGALRCDRLIPIRDLFDAGTRVVAGSDWISESMNPLYNIQIALTRRPTDGKGPAWNPDQQVALEELLKAYTINGAWQAGQENLTGSIEVGKAADLIVLQRNLFEVDPMHIKDVKVMQTFLEGELVFRLQ